MGLLGTRHRPKKEPTVRERLDAFVRATRVPDGVTLDALSDGLTPQVCLDAGRCYAPEKVVEDAFDVYFKAVETLRRSGVSSRASVRGCTAELLALVIAQVLRLSTYVEARGKRRTEHAASLAAVQQRLRANFARALSIREQARRVLAAMARDDASYLDEVLRAATAADDGGSAAAAMFALATIGKRLLGDGNPRTEQRAKLLGLDHAYLGTLEALGHDLRRGQEELSALAHEANTPDDAIYAEAGLTMHLMMHVIEAFAAAHEVDVTIPLLRPVHTQRMVRRISRLPPPPPPSIRPVARVADVKKVAEAKIGFLRDGKSIRPRKP
jgi:hypothetical protein